MQTNVNKWVKVDHFHNAFAHKSDCVVTAVVAVDVYVRVCVYHRVYPNNNHSKKKGEFAQSNSERVRHTMWCV